MFCLLLFYAIAVPQFNYAQSVKELQPSDSLMVTRWTVEDGLPVNATNQVIQDPEGYIWITTFDGLVRFDGHKFKVFNHANTPSIPNNRMIAMFLQKGTGLWITLEHGGILLYKKNRFIYFGKNRGLNGSRITAMLEDNRGRFWLGTANGLFIFKNERFERIAKRKSPLQNHITNLFVDSDGTIWVLTLNGIIKIKPQKNKTEVLNIKINTDVNRFRDIIEIKEGVYFIGTDTGLYKLEKGKFKSVHSKKFGGSSVPRLYKDKKITLISSDLYWYDNGRLQLIKKTTRNNYLTFFRDDAGLLWMLSEKGNLSILHKRGKKFTVKTFHRFDNYQFNAIFKGREGNLWLTTARDGIVRIKRKLVRTITKAEGLTGNNINAVFEDSRGRFWVAVRDYGLNMIDGNSVTHFRESGELSGDIVLSVAEDKSGNIWAGHVDRGIDKITPHGIVNYRLGRSEAINTVRAVYVARDSTIWLGTYGGLVKFNPAGKKHIVYTTEDGLANNYIRYIDEGADGGLWIATFNGLSYFKDGTFTNYTTEDGLSANNLRSVYVDEYDPGTVWIGTETNGLNRLRNGHFTSVGKKDGLPDHVIHNISQDSLGWLWMSSNRGIFKIKKDELNAYMDGETDYFSLIHYNKSDGMLNPECNGAFQNGGLRTSTGKFWFATQKGVAIIDIDSSEYKNIQPTIVIKNITAFGKTFTADKIHLKPQNNSFQIHFDALTFTSPEKTTYRYMLKGYDENWNVISGKHNVAYNNIPSGSYTFKVQAANGSGQWFAQPATASISVQPFFYEQWWFYMALFVLLGAGYYGASRWRYYYLMKRQQRLEKKIAEQTAQIRGETQRVREQAEELRVRDKTKDKLFSIIGHDLRGPLAGLIGLSDLLTEDHKNMNDEQREEMFTGINQASKSLHQLTENLLQWTTLQISGVKSYPELLKANELIERNMELFKQQAASKNIKLLNTTKNNPELFADENMSNTIIRNLLSNALKFTETGGSIILNAETKNGECRISVKDDGIGIPAEMLGRIMKVDKKTTRPGTKNEKGSGLGLSICKELAEEQKGQIFVKSEEDKGTMFTVVLPAIT